MNERAGRNVSERVLISGLLVLETPAHFGNGDAATLTDMTLTDMTLARDPRRTAAWRYGACVPYGRTCANMPATTARRGPLASDCSAESKTSSAIRAGSW